MSYYVGSHPDAYPSLLPRNPLAKIKVMQLDGVMHHGLNNMAKEAEKPMYPHATGPDRDAYRRFQTNALAFTIRSGDPVIDAIMNDSVCMNDDGSNSNRHVPVVDALNGLGDADESRDAFQRRIVFQGMIDNGGDTPQTNIITEGLVPYINIGDQTLNQGDRGVIYAPTVEEASNGGLKSRQQQNGVYRLWIHPLDENRHNIAPKTILRCLQAIYDKSEETRLYLKSYKNMCVSIQLKAQDTGLLTFSALGRDKIQELLEQTNDDSELLQSVVDEMKTDAFRMKFMLTMFPAQSQNPLWFEPSKRTQSPLNKRQAEALPGLLRALASYNDDLDKDCVGTIVSSMVPGQEGGIYLKKR